MNITRRAFVKGGLAASIGSSLWTVGRAADPAPRYRAAIIGCTGGGDYGHSYDQIFNGLEEVSVEAIADADPAGLKRAAERSGAKRPYADFREMLQREKPDLVCIAPRVPGCHQEMALAAIQVCRGLFVEKPFTETPAEADAILEAAARRNVQIQVAHNFRYTAEFVQTKALLEQGLIGRVREVNIHGKQDARAGGEDLIVLGVHDFDLMRFYFGDPLWCQASVTQAGRDIVRADVRQGREPILVAGDTIHALFAFPGGVVVRWSSVSRPDHWNTNFSPREKWAWEILGTKGIIARQGGIAWLDSPFLMHTDNSVPWRPLPEPAKWDWPAHARHPIRSLLHALETGAQPVCSGHDGRWAVEMVAAVYESQRTRARVSLPLQDRGNPLLRL